MDPECMDTFGRTGDATSSMRSDINTAHLNELFTTVNGQGQLSKRTSGSTIPDRSDSYPLPLLNMLVHICHVEAESLRVGPIFTSESLRNHTPLNSFIPDCFHRIFSDYNPDAS
ncbi:hypothetical protein YC2023_058916 [Brassica napus]